MKNIFSIIGYIFGIVALIYMLMMFLTFACIADTTHPADSCRGNMAGDLTAGTLQLFLNKK